MKKIITLFIITILFVSCSGSEDNITSSLIVGEWKLTKTVENGTDLTNDCLKKSRLNISDNLTVSYNLHSNDCNPTSGSLNLSKTSDTIYEANSNGTTIIFTIESSTQMRQTYSDPIGVEYTIWNK